MYAASSSAAEHINGMGPDVDGSGTIDPAALSAPLSLNPSALSAPAVDETATYENPPDPASAPRGVKRGRSEDRYAPGQEGDVEAAEGVVIQVPDDHAPRKRGRPPKTPRQSSGNVPASSLSPSSISKPGAAGAGSSATAHLQTATSPPQGAQAIPPQAADGTSPGQASPPSKTGGKPVVKALPTVRDHTTDQLDEAGDEFIPKERDAGGESKVEEDGTLQGDRTYKCRTFRIQSRGPKLFMLATECARVLGYRDSYLLFNKNRSLHKIIATQAEKDDLISQDVLPFSYRSRQIAIVTARSMFRQFGSRVIVNGRRVRDDYWESKAKKQGFTEEDLAGEKRPGAAKARDAAAAENTVNVGTLPALGHNDVVYTNAPPLSFEGAPPQLPSGLPPGFAPLPSNLAPLPMINPSPSDDARMREYSSFPRARQELGGPPYQDRTQPSSAADILNQASQSAEFNKLLNQQRDYRSKGLDDHWNKPHEPPPEPQDNTAVQSSSSAAAVESTPQALHHPHQAQHPDPRSSTTGLSSEAQQQGMMRQHQQPPPHYQQHPAQHAGGTPQSVYPPGMQQPQQTPISQSPMRSMGQTIRPDQLQHRSPGMAVQPGVGGRGYPYAQTHHYQQQPPPQQQQQLWGTPPHATPPQQQQPQQQQQQSSMMGMPQQFAPQMHPHQQSPSPHPHQTPSHRPSQSPRHQARPAPSPQIPGQPPPQVHQGQAMQQPVGYPGGTAAPYPAFSAGASSMYSASPAAVAGGGGQQFMPAQAVPGAPHQAVSMGVGMGTNPAALSGWPSTAGGGLMQPGQPPTGPPQGGWPAGY